LYKDDAVATQPLQPWQTKILAHLVRVIQVEGREPVHRVVNILIYTFF